eukprot:11188508-Lingulodinium_polyedra.AAC.1
MKLTICREDGRAPGAGSGWRAVSEVTTLGGAAAAGTRARGSKEFPGCARASAGAKARANPVRQGRGVPEAARTQGVQMQTPQTAHLRI